MFYVYKPRNKFFEFFILHDSVIDTMKKNNDWFITDQSIIDKIQAIDMPMRRFIVIQNIDKSGPATDTTNIVMISQDYVKEEVLKQLKIIRTNALSSLDVAFNKAQESYFSAANDTDRGTAQTTIAAITNDKNQWRNIDQNALLNPMANIQTHTDFLNLIKSIRQNINDPTYILPISNGTTITHSPDQVLPS
jgi:hypothetical protein